MEIIGGEPGRGLLRYQFVIEREEAVRVFNDNTWRYDDGAGTVAQSRFAAGRVEAGGVT
jgi:hypothetical protein